MYNFFAFALGTLGMAIIPRKRENVNENKGKRFPCFP